jgi:hypothetical protein
MVSGSYTVPTRTPNSTPSRKRKASTFLEVNALGSFASTRSYPSSTMQTQTSKSKSAYGTASDGDDNGFNPTPQTPRKRPRKGEPPEEKRLRVFRKHAPQSYLERLDRVRNQRMFLIDRERKASMDGNHDEEVFDIAGTTGNIYQVKISEVPSCTCSDAKKGNQCKHIVYVSGY